MLTRTSHPESTGAARTRLGGIDIAWSFTAVLFALVAIMLLVVQNSQTVRFEWLWIDFSASLAVMLLVTAIATLLATSLGGLIWRHRRRASIDHQLAVPVDQTAHDDTFLRARPGQTPGNSSIERSR